MPYVTCPTCGERGKIPPNLVGARIKCRKCGLSFMVAAPAAAAKAGASAQGSATLPQAVAEPLQGIEVEGLDASSWAVPTDATTVLKTDPGHEPSARPDAAPAFVAAEPGHFAHHEYKLLTPRDKIFDGKFDLARLEEALNHFGRQGWTVKSMSTPHVKGFSGALEELIVIVLER
jgi:hypothetical protein